MNRFLNGVTRGLRDGGRWRAPAWFACWAILGLWLLAPSLGLASRTPNSLAVSDASFRSTSGVPASPQRTKSIEEVVAGDVVLAWDELSGELLPKRVVQVFRNTADHLRIVRIKNSDGVDQEVRTTDEHPFYVPSRGWTEAADLRPGDDLVEADGFAATVVETTLEAHPEGVSVFNFEVEDAHTYFVSSDPDSPAVLAHNACTNSGGRRGGTAHQARVAAVERSMTSPNSPGGKWTHVSGGSKPEKAVTWNGRRRFADLVFRRGNETVAVQVGRRNKNGTPVAREVRALNDLRDSKVYTHVSFTEY